MKNKGAKQRSKKKGSDNAFGCNLIEHLQSSGQDGKPSMFILSSVCTAVQLIWRKVSFCCEYSICECYNAAIITQESNPVGTHTNCPIHTCTVDMYFGCIKPCQM